MNPRCLICALFALFLLSGCGEEDVTEPVHISTGKIGMWINPKQADMNYYDEALKTAKEAQVQLAHLYVQWGLTEKSSGEYDWTIPDFILGKFKKYGFEAVVVIPIIFTTKLDVMPEDITFESFSDPEFVSRFVHFTEVLMEEFIFSLALIFNMRTEHIVIISSLALAGLTAVYVLLTHRILKEQRKSAELAVIPDISFHFDKKNPIIGLNCIVKEKSIYNLTAEISIDGISKESKFLGNVIIRKQQTYNNSLFFDFAEHLRKLGEKNFTLGVKVSYESRSGSKIIELFTWKASMDSKGNLNLNENYPDSRELLLAPWT